MWSKATETSILIMDTLHPKIQTYQSPSKNFKNYFSEDGKQLYFGVGKKVKNPAKDTLTKDEKYQLDIWHWDEGRIQPQQLDFGLEIIKNNPCKIYSIISLYISELHIFYIYSI